MNKKEKKNSFLMNNCDFDENIINKNRFEREYEIIKVFSKRFFILFIIFLNKVLGHGCFGTVYKCKNKFDNIEYAVKESE